MGSRLRHATRWAGASLLVAAAGFAFPRPSSGAPNNAPSTGKGDFTILGSIGGLYPGETVPLTLTVTNLRTFNIQVTSIKASVGSASSSCKGSLLQVTGFSGSLAVPAGGSASTSVQVSLSHSAPDACQNALFPLSYVGKGQQA